jgi:predicted dehydrogenase
MALNVAFIGAGNRATKAHYPLARRLDKEGVVRLQAICDLNTERLNQAGDRFSVERRYTDYGRMLDDVELDAVYVIMPAQFSLQIVLDCLNAGKHVLVEKPPAMSAHDLETMAEAAERNGRVTTVCFQRRVAPVAQEVRRLILEQGPITMCIGEFHKNMLKSKGPSLGVSTLLDDVIHAVDFVRYMCGGEATEVHAFQDTFFTDWRNCYNGLIKFSTGAVGFVSGNRSSGARILRFEVHGKGIGAEIDMPNSARVWAGNGEPLVLTGEGLAGSANEQDYEGTLHIHREFVAAIAEGRQALTSFQECLGTMRLIESLEGGPYSAADRPVRKEAPVPPVPPVPVMA